MSLLPPLPASVRTLLDRCLAKDPRVRLRDIGEARVLLQGGGVAGDDVADPAPARPARSPLLSAIGLVVGVVLGALLFGPLFGGGDDPVDPGTSAAEAPPVRRFAQPPARDEKGKTIPWVDSMLSPDGRYLAASTEDEFVIRSLDTLETTSLQLERTGLGSAT